MNELTRWTRKSLPAFRSEMDRLFDRFFEGGPSRSSLAENRAEWVPSLDISETSNKIIVKAEIPGMDPKDIQLTVSEGLLTIRGERKQEKEEKDENFHRIEQSYGAFSRSLQLPAEVDPNEVEAKYKKGVLSITMLKTRKAAQKKIEIKTA